MASLHRKQCFAMNLDHNYMLLRIVRGQCASAVGGDMRFVALFVYASIFVLLAMVYLTLFVTVHLLGLEVAGMMITKHSFLH